MLNLFQHLIKSTCYETLKRVQGDKKQICATGSFLLEKAKLWEIGLISILLRMAGEAAARATATSDHGGVIPLKYICIWSSMYSMT